MAFVTAADFSALRSFARTLTVLAVIAATIRIALGPQWFSLYGAPVMVLAALVPLGRMALDGSRRRWPIWLLIAATALAALGHIGFWLTFFHGGATGLFIGIGRSMARPLVEYAWPAMAGGLTVIWIVVLGKKLMRAKTIKAP